MPMQVTKPTVEEAIEFVTHIEQSLQVGHHCTSHLPPALLGRVLPGVYFQWIYVRAVTSNSDWFGW
jgi:hypothetical protein